jgi:peptide/nickel transport system permease protein
MRALRWTFVLYLYAFCSLVLPQGLVETPVGRIVFFPQVLRYASEKVDYLALRGPTRELILAQQQVDFFEKRVSETETSLAAVQARVKASAAPNRTQEVELAAAEEERLTAGKALDTWQARLTAAEAAAKEDDTIAIMPPIGYHHDDGDRERIRERPIYAHAGWGTCHILGTDQSGRDVAARILYGTRVSLTVGVIAVAIYCTIGTIIGAIMGFFGGWVDMLLMRFVEIMMCFPTLAFILIVVSIFGKNIFLIIVALAIVSWTAAARLVRGQFLQERAQDYVTAARALGIPTRRIVFKHILPNAIHPVFITATFGVAGAILLEASLAFLGLGDARVPSWGQILLEGRTTQKLWLILSPGVAIFLTVTVLNLVGEGVRDALDPKLRQ